MRYVIGNTPRQCRVSTETWDLHPHRSVAGGRGHTPAHTFVRVGGKLSAGRKLADLALCALEHNQYDFKSNKVKTVLKKRKKEIEKLIFLSNAPLAYCGLCLKVCFSSLFGYKLYFILKMYSCKLPFFISKDSI